MKIKNLLNGDLWFDFSIEGISFDYVLCGNMLSSYVWMTNGALYIKGTKGLE